MYKIILYTRFSIQDCVQDYSLYLYVTFGGVPRLCLPMFVYKNQLLYFMSYKIYCCVYGMGDKVSDSFGAAGPSGI